MVSLAELKAEAGPEPRPVATVTVTLVRGQHLLDESNRLRERLVDVLARAEVSEEEAESRAAAQKWSETAEPDEAEAIKAEHATILPRLAEYQADLGLVGISGGDWQRFKEEHPPRKDNAADQRLTGSWCDADALFAALGRFVSTWDGEPVQPGAWDEWLAEKICYADRRDLVSTVVDMYETRVNRIPKSSSDLFGTPTSETN